MQRSNNIVLMMFCLFAAYSNNFAMNDVVQKLLKQGNQPLSLEKKNPAKSFANKELKRKSCNHSKKGANNCKQCHKILQDHELRRYEFTCNAFTKIYVVSMLGLIAYVYLFVEPCDLKEALIDIENRFHSLR